MGKNDHLLQTPSGDKKAAVEIDIGDGTISTGRANGYVRPGNWSAKIVDGAWEDGGQSGKNLWLQFECEGVTLNMWNTAPVGQGEEVGMRHLRDAIVSCLSTAGKLKERVNTKMKVAPATVIGKSCFIRVETETEGKYRGTSKPRGFLTKEQYDAAPGAKPGADMAATRPTNGASGSPPQGGVPETGAGAGPRAQEAPVADDF